MNRDSQYRYHNMVIESIIRIYSEIKPIEQNYCARCGVNLTQDLLEKACYKLSNESIHSIYSLACLIAGPYTVPKLVLYRVQCSASSYPKYVT